MKYLYAALIGAIIGYITNYLAIKMLFRPYNEIRILGVKIPFTPGLIPKERKRIAKSVGEAIGTHLLTKDILVKTLLDSSMENHIKGFLSEKIKEIKELELRNLAGENIISNIFNIFGDNISLKDEAYNIIKKNENKIIQSRTKVKDIIPMSLISSASVLIYQKKDDIAQALEKKLNEEGTKFKIQQVVSETLTDKISPMIAMFINKESIGSMVISSINSYLNSEKGREEIAKIAIYYFNTALDKEAADILKELPEEGKRSTISSLSEKIEHEGIAEIERLKKNLLDTKISYILDEKNEDFISEFIINTYMKFIKNHAGNFIQAIDIPKIIEDNINSFDVSYAEEIIMDISRKELSAITWLGALLGGIIGILSPLIGQI